MNDPDVYYYELEVGRADPVPWYYAYFQLADRCNCAPWELIDEPTPKDFWVQAAYIVVQAEAEHARFKQTKGNGSEQTQSVPGAIGK